jgi:hypothetical protein
MNQEKMQQLHETISNLVAYHGSGIITDLEFANAVSDAAKPLHNTDLTGLIDVNTGLRY